MSGTSMAAPHISGIVALMRAQMPTLTYAEIVSRLFAKTDVMGAWNGLVAAGGCSDAYRAISENLPQTALVSSAVTGRRGAAVALSTTATDPLGGSLSYQWRKAGVNINGATTAVYSVGSLQTGNEGSYDCLVTNATGTVATARGTISLLAGPDFDGNSSPDILWTQASTGRRLIWTMNGTARLNAQGVELGTVTTDWQIEGTADFDSNGSPDLVWTQRSTGRRLLWTMNGAARLNAQGVELGTITTDWQMSAFADFDGNGTPDILWTQRSTGRRMIWRMNGTTKMNVPGVELGTVAVDWQINGAGDFDGNGSPDILFTQASTGRRLLWLMSGTTRLNSQGAELGIVPVDWAVSGIGDFDRNGSPDILWTQASTGKRVIWTMARLARLNSTGVTLGTIGTDWGSVIAEVLAEARTHGGRRGASVSWGAGWGAVTPVSAIPDVDLVEALAANLARVLRPPAPPSFH
ncbi:MAG: VCBS repeat-containing protein [Opitutaceae bacterium]|nr:VCBS repeat-containing protein [Opitutaceae bacterium]